jgi:hypothetical protein
MALAAWLVTLSHGATALHFALISHEICADHGEVVHAQARAAHAAHHASTTSALPGGEHSGHDHCPLMGRRVEQSAFLPAPELRVEGLDFLSARAAVEGVTVARSRAELLLFAPKQSPPV